jgi:hypothetical protein
MKEMKRDILSENPQLRKQAYTAPDGYFEEFRSQINPYREAQQKWTEKLVPFVSMAATFILMVTAGTFFLQRTTPSEEFTQEDFLVFSSEVSRMDYYEEMDHIADAGIADEDIVEYLIYSGVSAEEIELSK